MRGLSPALAVCLVLSASPRAAAQDAGADARVPARLSLADAVRIAEARSPLLAVARAGIGMADAEAIGAGKRPNPSLSVESQGYPLFSADRPSFANTQELTVAIDQELEPGGRRRWRVESARLEGEAARAGVRDQFRRLRLDVQRAYMAVVLAAADLDAATSTLADVDTVVALNQARHDQGELSGVELRRAQVERHRFADEALLAELALRNARSRLLALLDLRPLDQEFETTDRLEGPGGAPPAAAAFTDDGLAGRADLTALRLEEQRAGAEAELQRALRVPAFSVGAGWQRNFGTNAIVARATVPLPLRNRNESGLARAAAERSLAASRVSAAAAGAALEAQLAANAVASSRERASRISADYVRLARESRDIVLASYRAGAATLIDLLDAQRALRDARRAENRARFDYQVSGFELEAALGEQPARRP